jgi:hypothetical protein
MTPQEIEAAIRADVEVTAALVFQAKAYLVAHAPGRTTELNAGFVADLGAGLVSPIVIHASADHVAVVRDVARWLACHVAAGEAAWALVGAGALVPRSPGFEAARLYLPWTTVVPGSGGESSGWNFDAFAIPVPAVVALPSSGPTHLTDGDLFLRALDLTDLDQTIAESLQSAVACFRSDLYLPAQIMLGRAAEGAWTLLGEALVAGAPTEQAAVAVGRDLARGMHFARLPERVASLYSHPAYAGLVTTSGVRMTDLRGALNWTEALREARNAVHHGSAAPVLATWETAAVLLMGAVPNLRLLWNLRAAAIDRRRTHGGEPERET